MNIGDSLKAIRHEKNYTLKQVAEKLEITESFLSQIENNKISPSLHSLESLLHFYAVNLSDFFRQVEQKRFILIKKEEQQALENHKSGCTMILLASKLQNNALESFIVELKPGAKIETALLKPDINGERIIYIESGSLELSVDMRENFILHKGDSLNFKSYVYCAIKNIHDSNSSFFIAGLPPVFI